MATRESTIAGTSYLAALTAVLCTASACAPLNFGLIVGHEARLNEQARRIVLLEGYLVALSPQGQAMAAVGNPDVLIEARFPTNHDEAGGYVVLVPKHLYAGSIVRHFMSPDRLPDVAGDLEHLVRIEGYTARVEQESAIATATLHNVPDGEYVVGATDYYKIRNPQTYGVEQRVRGFYVGEVQIRNGSSGPVDLIAGEDVDKPAATDSKFVDPMPDPPPKTWRSVPR